MLVTREGLLEMVGSKAILDVGRACGDPADRITYALKGAFRAGVYSPAEALRLIGARADAAATAADRSKANHQHERARRQLAAAAELQGTADRLRDNLRALDAAGIRDLHVRLASGQSLTLHARFSARDGLPRLSARFTLPTLRLVAVGAGGAEIAPAHVRPAARGQRRHQVLSWYGRMALCVLDGEDHQRAVAMLAPVRGKA